MPKFPFRIDKGVIKKPHRKKQGEREEFLLEGGSDRMEESLTYF